MSMEILKKTIYSIVGCMVFIGDSFGASDTGSRLSSDGISFLNRLITLSRNRPEAVRKVSSFLIIKSLIRQAKRGANQSIILSMLYYC